MGARPTTVAASGDAAADAGAAKAGAAADAWLELAVAADHEAVEAVSEILARVANGGTTVEPAFLLTDEGLGAHVDPSRPAIVRGYVPARDPASAEAARVTVETALGHLRAFDLRPIGPLATRLVHEADWASAWKAHFPVLRIGRRLVIRPSWRRHRPLPDDVVLALDPGMAFGTGLHPTTRLCLAALEAIGDQGPGARVLDVGCGSGILLIAALKLGAGTALGVDIDPIAVEATRANARRNGVARRVRVHQATLPTGEPPFDLVLANLIASLLVALADELFGELRAGGTLIASGIFRDREPDVTRAFAAAGLAVVDRAAEGDWVALTAVREGLGVSGGRSLGCRPMAAIVPIVLVCHIALAVGLFLPSILLPFALRARRSATESHHPFVRLLLWMQANGTVIIGAGLAITGILLVAVLGPQLLVQPWLLLALTIYGLNLGLAFFLQRPNLRRLVGIRAADDDRSWLARARRQRYVSYLMAGLVGTIGFLMSTKPILW